MSKEKKPKFPNGYVALDKDLLASKAYRDLSKAGAKMLPLVLGKVYKNLAHHEAYLVKFELTYAEMENRLGYSTSTISKVITELIGLGFIDPVIKGGLNIDMKRPSVFRLSKRWRHFGERGFKKINWKEFYHVM